MVPFSPPPLETEDAKRKQREDDHEEVLEKWGPPEIRNQIMELAIPTDGIIDISWGHIYHFTDRKKNEIANESLSSCVAERGTCGPPQPSATQTCHKLRSEGLTLYYGTNTFLVWLNRVVVDTPIERWIRVQPEEGLRISSWIAFKLHDSECSSSCATILLLDCDAKKVQRLECYDWQIGTCRTAAEQHQILESQVFKALSAFESSPGTYADRVCAILSDIAAFKVAASHT